MASSMVTDDTHGQDNMRKPLVGTNGAGPNQQPGTAAPLINVQPPRREDLQPKYAQILTDDDAGDHGWYGGMSTSTNSTPLADANRLSSQHSRQLYWNHGRLSLLHLLPESIQARLTRTGRPSY